MSVLTWFSIFWLGFLGVILGVFCYRAIADEVKVRMKALERRRKEYRPPLGCRLFGHQWADSGHRIPVIAFLDSPLEICDRCAGGRYMHLMSAMHFTPKAVADYLAQCKAEQEGKVATINGGVKLEKVADNVPPTPPEKGPYAS
jgi:hypothetical protein